MILSLMTVAFAAEQGGIVPNGIANGTPLDLQIVVNFDNETNCSVTGVNAGVFDDPTDNEVETDTFPAWGSNGLGSTGLLEGFSVDANDWRVGADVNVRCQQVSGSPADVDVTVEGLPVLGGEAMLSFAHGQLNAGTPLGAATPVGQVIPDGFDTIPLGLAARLDDTDPSGSGALFRFTFVGS